MAMPPPPRSLRVAVIGAGAAGLAAARELRREGHATVVFERAHAVGGTWLLSCTYRIRGYDDTVKYRCNVAWLYDHRQHRSSSSLYASLRTNLPREIMGFLDFPFAAAPDSVDARRFPRHQEVLRYIQAFARRFHLDDLVRLRTEVLAVTKDDDEGSSWRVRWRRNAAAGDEAEQLQEEVFDAVVVCNGHYTEPRTAADIPGLDTWPPGKQMHSHSYRVPGPFADQVVVIVGASNSGADISREIAAVAREVHMADRWAPAATCRRLPGYLNLWLHSMVERADADGTTVVFRDGSSVRADVVMHCTGYKYSFPFLLTTTAGDADTPGSAVVSVDDNRIHPLYKHVFVPQLAPHLAFIGLPFKVIPFPMFQLQASWVAGALSGRIQLPSEDEMMEDVRALYSDLEAVGWPVRYTHCMKHSQFEYDEWLAEQCGGKAGRVEEWRKDMFDATRKKHLECPETYRDEWDDHHLLEQAYQDFNKYTP